MKHIVFLALICFLFSCDNKFLYSDLNNGTIFHTPVDTGVFPPAPVPPEILGDRCDWGPTGPAYFECEDQTYIYGIIVTCQSGIYNNIFCNKRYESDGLLCVGDNSPDTLRCFRDKIGRHF